MRRPIGLLVIALLMASGGPALAAGVVASEGPEAVALTIYPDPGGERAGPDLEYDDSTGLALVTEWRTLDVPAGESVLTFRGVAEGIVPETAALDGLPARMVERNQDYDLLSPGSLIAGSVGARVKRVRTNRQTGAETVEDAIIRSGPNGVVLEVDGRFEALGCGGQAERLVFERAPPGLSDKPTLSMRVRTQTAGRYRVRLSYLAVGLLWSANYVAEVRPDGRMDLLGWVTLSNLSDTTFADAPTQFVAGELESTGETTATEVQAQTVQTRCWPSDTTTRGQWIFQREAVISPSPMIDGDVSEIVVTAYRRSENLQDVPTAISTVQSELGDYKLYTLPGLTTVAARQTKQVRMLSREGVSFDRVYRFGVYDGETWTPDTVEPATLVLKTKNSKAKGLGLPLPGGNVALMQTDPSGRRILAAESSFGNTPVDGPLEIGVGDAPGLRVRPRQVRTWVRGERTLTEYELAVTSTRDDAVTLEVIHRGDPETPLKVVAETRRHARAPLGLTWSLPVASGENLTLRYTIETRD